MLRKWMQFINGLGGMILMRLFAKEGALLLCLSAMLMLGTDVRAAVFGTLEQDGSTFRVTSLTENPSNDSPFEAPQSPGHRRWNFGWSDLQPGFPTVRRECKNPDRPLSCLKGKTKTRPLCSTFDNMEDGFVKLALTKSGYGDTPTERGIPSAWSKMSTGDKAAMVVFGPAVAIGGAVGVGMAAVVVSPFLAISAAMNPECVGWDTKWVEFDHDSFGEKLREALAAQGWDTPEARNLIETRYAAFVEARNSVLKAESSRLTADVNAALQKAAPYEKLIERRPRHSSAPPYTKFDTQIKKWTPASDATEILPDYQVLAQTTSEKITSHYAAQRDLMIAAANAHTQRVLSAAAEVSKARFAASDTSQKMETLQNDLQTFADPAGLLPQVRERLASLYQSENAQRLAENVQRLAEAKQRAEQEKNDELLRKEKERKTEIALQVFRKGLKIGMDTNCGPVVELRPPMVKIAVAVRDYGTEHWLKISTIWPPGAGCSFYNGSYDPPG